MNTTARLTTRTAAMAACLAALFAGATACGTETETSSAHTNAASSIDQIESVKASQSRYLQQLAAKAEQAHVTAQLMKHYYASDYGNSSTSQQFGDDRRQAIDSRRQHAAGFNKALLAER